MYPRERGKQGHIHDIPFSLCDHSFFSAPVFSHSTSGLLHVHFFFPLEAVLLYVLVPHYINPKAHVTSCFAQQLHIISSIVVLGPAR